MRHGGELHEGVAPADREIAERRLDLVIGIDPHAHRAALGDQFLGHRLAGVAFLHADHQALEIVDAVDVGMADGIDDQRLP